MKVDDTKIEYPISTQLFLKVGGIIMILVGLFFFKMSWQLEYVQIIPIFFGSLFFMLGSVCFFEGFKQIIINAEGVEQKRILKKKKIAKNDVKGYAEVIHRGSKGNNTQLIIFSKNKNEYIKVEKIGWGDKYNLLLKKIKSDYKKVGFEEVSQITKRRKNLYKNIGKGLGVFIFIFGLYQLIFIDIIPPERFHQLDGVIAAKPIIAERRKGRIESMTFELDKYEEFIFSISGEAFRMLHVSAKKLNKGDEVSLKVLKADYQQKLNKSIPPDFKSKYVNWNIIRLYEIAYSGQTLLDSRDLNTSRSNPIPKIFLMIFGMGIFLYYKYVSKGSD